MSDLDELYQTLILEHNRRPRNFRQIEQPTAEVEGRNPMCGDTFKIWIRVDGDRIADVSFLGQGCAISKASASMMTTAIKGKTVEEARALFTRFQQVVTGRREAAEAGLNQAREVVGCLSAFAGVAAFPVRVKCATLAWHAMRTALDSSVPTP
ncbi:MAG: Fe-S cluster assembly sulfur transfer protein SufU [Gemmatimonadota bacterium]